MQNWTGIVSYHNASGHFGRNNQRTRQSHSVQLSWPSQFIRATCPSGSSSSLSVTLSLHLRSMEPSGQESSAEGTRESSVGKHRAENNISTGSNFHMFWIKHFHLKIWMSSVIKWHHMATAVVYILKCVNNCSRSMPGYFSNITHKTSFLIFFACYGSTNKHNPVQFQLDHRNSTV